MKKIYITEEQYNGLINEVRYLTPPNYKTRNYDNEQPVKDSESIRVFHGFNRFSDAENVMKNGLSGKENANRIYSFELGNNPYGLFVSIDFNLVAKNFAHSGVIIEFTTRVYDLEAPVWVGGRSYFVQGEYTQSFKNLGEREQQRLLNRQKSGENPYEAISKSDRPELAETLFNNFEKQALYIGDLNPNMIKYVWYNERLHKDRMTDGKWERLTRKDFINKLNVKTKKDDYDIWYPNDDFSLDKFFDANNLASYYKDKKLRIDDPLFYMFMNYNEYELKQTMHLFPKQIKQIMDLRKTDYFQKYIDEHNNNI